VEIKVREQPVEITFQFFPDAEGNNSVASKCNAIMFYNAGTSQAAVNRHPLAPGSTLVLSGDYGDKIITTFSLTYTGTGTNSVVVTKKTYA
jgi:hypothetical protein